MFFFVYRPEPIPIYFRCAAKGPINEREAKYYGATSSVKVS